MDAAFALGLLGIGVVVTGYGLRCRDSNFARLLVLAMIATRPSIDWAGFTIRPELVVSCLAIARLVIYRKSPVKLCLAVQQSVIITVAWLLVLAVTSATSPRPLESMSLIAWTALSLCAALWVAKNPAIWKGMVSFAAASVAVTATAAVVVWAGAVLGLSTLGVQPDPAYGGYAAYVVALEANLLAGFLCLWGLVALFNPFHAVGRRLQGYIAVAVPMALIATHTRAALVGFCVGVIILLLARRIASGALLWAGLASIAVALSGLRLSRVDAGLSKFTGLLDVTSGTGAQRLRLSDKALQDWRDSDTWLFGLGYNSFGHRNFDLTRPGEFAPAYVGNLPVQIVHDGGVFAAVALTLAACLTILRLTMVRALSPAVAIGLPYLLLSLATSSLWLLQTWVLVGLAWGAASRRPLQNWSTRRLQVPEVA